MISFKFRDWSPRSIPSRGCINNKGCKTNTHTHTHLWQKYLCFGTFNLSVLRQKDESQDGDNKKTKHAEFSEKWTFTSWYAQIRAYLACFVFLVPLVLRFALLFKLISCHWSLHTPWKHLKTFGFVTFLGGIERNQWHEMG